MPRFSILHTSARPDKWREIYDAWMSNCDNPKDIEYVLVTDPRWGFQPIDKRDFELKKTGHLTFKHATEPLIIQVQNDGRRCYVEGVNLAAKHSTGDILIVIADDQYPCEHWDTRIACVMPNLKVDGRDFIPTLLHVTTGTPDEFARQITPMPIMNRSLYEKWGYVFYPEYESMYADNDLCDHAKAEGVLAEARHLFFPHKHAMFNENGWVKNPKLDEAYKAQNRLEAYTLGKEIYNRRKASRFGSVKPIAKTGKKTLAVCLPGETFSHEWVTAWTASLPWLSQHFSLLPPFFGYSSNPHITRAALLNNIFSVCAAGNVPDYILWIDDDNPVEPVHLKQLFEDLEEHPEIDVIAAWCWMKDGKRISAGNFAEDGSSRPLPFDQLMSGLHDIWRVDWTGFPCVIVKTEVFMKVQNPFGMMECNIWPGFYGEDMAFSRRATAAGFMIAVDRRVRVPHLKLGDIPDPAKNNTGAAKDAPEAIYQGEYL